MDSNVDETATPTSVSASGNDRLTAQLDMSRYQAPAVSRIDLLSTAPCNGCLESADGQPSHKMMLVALYPSATLGVAFGEYRRLTGPSFQIPPPGLVFQSK